MIEDNLQLSKEQVNILMSRIYQVLAVNNSRKTEPDHNAIKRALSFQGEQNYFSILTQPFDDNYMTQISTRNICSRLENAIHWSICKDYGIGYGDELVNQYVLDFYTKHIGWGTKRQNFALSGIGPITVAWSETYLHGKGVLEGMSYTSEIVNNGTVKKDHRLVKIIEDNTI